MIAFDTTFLTLMFLPGAKHDIPNAVERVEFLFSDISDNGEKILVPTPAFAEILIKSGPVRETIINELGKASKFLIASFDLRSAIDLSLMSDAAFTRKDKKDGASGTWVKVKFDRQIVAIAKAFGARAIYSEDDGVKACATREELPCYGVCDIKLPEPRQPGFWGNG